MPLMDSSTYLPFDDAAQWHDLDHLKVSNPRSSWYGIQERPDDKGKGRYDRRNEPMADGPSSIPSTSKKATFLTIPRKNEPRHPQYLQAFSNHKY